MNTVTKKWMEFNLPQGMDNNAYYRRIRKRVTHMIDKYIQDDAFYTFLTYLTIDYLAKNNWPPLSAVHVNIAIKAVYREAFSQYYQSEDKPIIYPDLLQRERSKYIREHFPTSFSQTMLHLAIQSVIKLKFHKDLSSTSLRNALIASVTNVLADQRPARIDERILSLAIEEGCKRLIKEGTPLFDYLIKRKMF